MTPRLTKYGRQQHAKYPKLGFTIKSSRPSPAERLRQRRKARAAVMRWHSRRVMRILGTSVFAEIDQQVAHLMRGRQHNSVWPQSRGTTTGQLVAMHLEAEDRNDT